MMANIKNKTKTKVWWSTGQIVSGAGNARRNVTVHDADASMLEAAGTHAAEQAIAETKDFGREPQFKDPFKNPSVANR